MMISSIIENINLAKQLNFDTLVLKLTSTFFKCDVHLHMTNNKSVKDIQYP